MNRVASIVHYILTPLWKIQVWIMVKASELSVENEVKRQWQTHRHEAKITIRTLVVRMAMNKVIWRVR